MSSNDNHFNHVFWFIVGLCVFGAGFTVFLITYLPEKTAERVADTALIFWLSTAVAGGIGYLLGSNATLAKKEPTSPITGDQPTVTINPAIDENKS